MTLESAMAFRAVRPCLLDLPPCLPQWRVTRKHASALPGSPLRPRRAKDMESPTNVEIFYKNELQSVAADNFHQYKSLQPRRAPASTAALSECLTNEKRIRLR